MKLSIAEILNFLSVDPKFAERASAGLKAKTLDINEPQNSTAWEVITDACEGVRENKWKKLSAEQRIITLFAIFEFLPCYASSSHLYQTFAFDEYLDQLARNQLWKGILRLLDSDDNYLREPIEYVLWVDFFEDPSSCERVWLELTKGQLTPKVLDRLLVIAGPVPFRLKQPYYKELAKQPERHSVLAESLAHSMNDIYGKSDPIETKRFLKLLQLPPENQHLKYLRGKFSD